VLTVFLQQVAGYSAMAAGLSLLPVTLLMFTLSPVFGRLAGRRGPRLFMTVGPLMAAVGFALMTRIDARASYVTQLLPGVLVFGLGLSATVAPLTAAVLGGIDERHAGIGSAINNAIARVAGLLSVAALGAAAASVAALHTGLWSMAGLLALGGLISAVGIRNAPPAV
jgi:predicted MFS family arabinose efflux permease